jgi:hypothetical protein
LPQRCPRTSGQPLRPPLLGVPRFHQAEAGDRIFFHV